MSNYYLISDSKKAFNRDFEQFSLEFITIFKDRHALCKEGDGEYTYSISICNHAPNHIKVCNKFRSTFIHLESKKDNVYTFKGKDSFIIINLDDLSCIIYGKGGFDIVNNSTTTGMIGSLIPIPIEEQLWYSSQRPDYNLLKQGKLYWCEQKRLFFYEGQYVDQELWSWFGKKRVYFSFTINWRDNFYLRQLVTQDDIIDILWKFYS